MTDRQNCLIFIPGEPINPEAWQWYHKYVGGEKCSISDTYWQTETGGHVMTPLPGCTPTKPGSACFPFFGVLPVILDESGKEMEGEAEGYIAFKKPWPGIMRTVYGNHERFESTYFQRFPGYYMSGDGAKRDSDGYIWITGRVDDMLNCSGKTKSNIYRAVGRLENLGVPVKVAFSQKGLMRLSFLQFFKQANLIIFLS